MTPGLQALPAPPRPPYEQLCAELYCLFPLFCAELSQTHEYGRCRVPLSPGSAVARGVTPFARFWLSLVGVPEGFGTLAGGTQGGLAGVLEDPDYEQLYAPAFTDFCRTGLVSPRKSH